MDQWVCTDKLLCSYATVIRGTTYRAQRTYLNSVEVWCGERRIGVAPSPATWREDSWRIASEHAKEQA